MSPAPAARRRRPSAPFPVLGALAAALVAALLAGPAPARAQIDVQGTVYAGSRDNEAAVEVTNASDQAPVEGLSVTVASRPRYLANIRITPARVAAVPPGQRAAFVVRFDARPEAPAGQSETLELLVTAERGSTIDVPDPKLTVTFAKAPSAVAAPGASTTQPGVGARPGPPAGGPGPSGRAGAPPLEDDWYVITVRGTGLRLGEGSVGSPEVLSRARGSHDFVRSVKRGEDVQVLIQDVRAGLARPWCEGVHTGPVDFYEETTVTATGPFRSVAEARARLRGDSWQHVEKIPNVTTEEALRRFGCGGGLASRDAGRARDGGAGGPGTTGGPSGSAAGRAGGPGVAGSPGGPVAAGAGGPGAAGSGGGPVAGSAGGPGTSGGPGGAGGTPRSGGDAGSSIAAVPTSPGVPAPSPVASAPSPGASAPSPGPSAPSAGAPDPSPGAPDPRSPRTAGLIRQWLGVAQPPDNARGARLRYDEWGRAVGTGVNGETIASRGQPDGAGPMSPPEFAWTLRDQLDSLDHCTLGEFVVRGGATAGCQGRHAPPPRTVAGGVGPDASAPVPDVRGRPAAAAQAELQRAGFRVELRGGDPAPSRDREFTVQDQRPAGGSSAPGGSAVTLRIHAASAAARTVPGVAGLPAQAARAQVEAAGFAAELVGGDPASSRETAFTVQAQEPAAGAAAAAGSPVRLRVHSAFAERAPAPVASAPPAPSQQAAEPPPARSQQAATAPPPARAHDEQQRAQQCGALLRGGDDAYHAGRLEESLAAYRQAWALRCPAPDLPGAIAGVEREILQRNQRAQHCTDLITRGNAATGAGRPQEALHHYSQARQAGCSAPSLDGAIASAQAAAQRQQQQQQQAQHCTDLITRGNAATGAGRPQEALHHYSQARQAGCSAPGLDGAIASAQAAAQRQQQQQQQAQHCTDLITRGNAATGAGRPQEALHHYSQARQAGCSAPGLDGAIASAQAAAQRQQQQQQQAQHCTDLVNRGTQARNAGRLHEAVNHYSQARSMNCAVPWLDDAIAQTQNQLRQSRTGPASPPPQGGAATPPRSSRTCACPPGLVLYESPGLLGTGDVYCTRPGDTRWAAACR